MFFDLRKNLVPAHASSHSTSDLFKPGWLAVHALVIGAAFYLGHRMWPEKQEEEE